MTTPQDEFVASIEHSKAVLNSLQHELQNFLGTNPDAINWGHVGDAKHIEHSLRSILKFARDEAE